jgi:hypothetical protein
MKIWYLYTGRRFDMAGQRSRAELLKFLDYVKNKGLINPTTAEARKASANKVLGILSDEEAEDALAIDLNQVITRFGNLHGKQYTPDSLRTYHSRTKASLDDFRRYLENPMSFKSGIQNREKKSKNGPSAGSVVKPEQTQRSPQSTNQNVAAPAVESSILPIPLREGLVVRIQGLPFDLTAQEAKKIANVVVAMALPTD